DHELGLDPVRSRQPGCLVERAGAARERFEFGFEHTALALVEPGAHPTCIAERSVVVVADEQRTDPPVETPGAREPTAYDELLAVVRLHLAPRVGATTRLVRAVEPLG